jgi:hypothetical protein
MIYLSIIIIKVVAVGHMKVPECVKIILCVIVQGYVFPRILHIPESLKSKNK